MCKCIGKQCVLCENISCLRESGDCITLLGECTITKNDKSNVIGKINEYGYIDKELYNDGYIYKNYDEFENTLDGICYVPELCGDWMPGTTEDDTEEADIYTRQDFLKITDGDEGMAKILFDLVEWQHPETLYKELMGDIANGF